MSDHTVRAYDDDLGRLKTMLAQMGGLAEEQLARAMQQARLQKQWARQRVRRALGQ